MYTNKKNPKGNKMEQNGFKVKNDKRANNKKTGNESRTRTFENRYDEYMSDELDIGIDKVKEFKVGNKKYLEESRNYAVDLSATSLNEFKEVDTDIIVYDTINGTEAIICDRDREYVNPSTKEKFNTPVVRIANNEGGSKSAVKKLKNSLVEKLG